MLRLTSWAFIALVFAIPASADEFAVGPPEDYAVEIEQQIEFTERLTDRHLAAITDAFAEQLTESFVSRIEFLGVADSGGKLNFEASFPVANVRLGAPGGDAMFVYADVPGFCGSGGCTTHFLVHEGSRWKEIGSSFGCAKLVVMKSLSKELRDVLATTCKSGNSYVLKFNGSTYEDHELDRLPDAERVAWYQLLAERGDIRQQINLGAVYENGRGASKNDVRAYIWYARAANHWGESGYSGMRSDRRMAAEKLKALAKRMPQEQLIQAERMARDWEPEDLWGTWFK